jgi:hypothetical protein
VNSKEGKLKAKRRAFLMDDVDLIGTEYLWRVSILSSYYRILLHLVPEYMLEEELAVCIVGL